MSTHRPICRRLLPDSMQGCWPALWVLRAGGDFSGVLVPCHSQSPGALGQGVCAEWCWQPGSLQRTKPKGQAGTITRGHFISRRGWAVFWWQATVRGSDKKHLNPIMDESADGAAGTMLGCPALLHRPSHSSCVPTLKTTPSGTLNGRVGSLGALQKGMPGGPLGWVRARWGCPQSPLLARVKERACPQG